MNYNELFIDDNLPEPLSQNDFYICFEKMKSGDTDARELIIKHSIRLVIYQVLKYFYNTPYEKNELVSIGLIGLIKSVDTFEISKNIKFCTYAVKCIDNEINMFLRKEKKYLKAESLDKPISIDKDGYEFCLRDALFDVNSDFVSDYENKEINIVVRQVVENLSLRDKEVISLYFGFTDNNPLNQYEIAKRLGISQSYISRVIIKALKHIKRQLQECEIVESSNTKIIKKRI